MKTYKNICFASNRRASAYREPKFLCRNPIKNLYTDGRTDGRADRQTDRQTDSQAKHDNLWQCWLSSRLAFVSLASQRHRPLHEQRSSVNVWNILGWCIRILRFFVWLRFLMHQNVHLFLCLSVSVCLSACLRDCLPDCLSVCLSVRLTD